MGTPRRCRVVPHEWRASCSRIGRTPRRRRQPVPHVRQRPWRVRFPGLVARDIAAVDVCYAQCQLLLGVASRCPLEHADQTLIEMQRAARRLRLRFVFSPTSASCLGHLEVSFEQRTNATQPCLTTKAGKAALARRMRDNGEPVPLIADQLNVSRATLYRYLAEAD